MQDKTEEVRAKLIVEAANMPVTAETAEVLADRGLPIIPGNIPKISEFVFEQIDESYHTRAVEARDPGGHVVVGGHNYGQGSSREHAALAPRYLGLRLVIAKSFTRIQWQNLVNLGVLPLMLTKPSDYDRLELRVENLEHQPSKNTPS